MKLLKRLHWLMLKTFLPLFAMTFLIVLFIVLMQFLWKYIDDLVGKGLSLDVLGELFFYAAVSMVPMALPLAILLASLMTFGNLGEKFELTAMKASGISLIRVMAPLIVTVGAIAIGAFFFQNYVLPKAQVKMWTLLFSMRQKSPELEIPEDVFYDQIPGFNLYVKHKDKSGMLKDVMIYDVSNGGDNASIITADSARLAFTSDMRYLYLHLYKGEQFENLRDQNNRRSGINTPFRRETFLDKQVLIPFDANFNRLDEGGMRKQYVGKNMQELLFTMDSISTRIDSLGYANLPSLRSSELSIVERTSVSGGGNGGSNDLERMRMETPHPGFSRMDREGDAGQSAIPPVAGTDVNTEISGHATNQNPNGPEAESKSTAKERSATEKARAKVAPIKIDTLIASLPEITQSGIYGNAMSMSQRRQDILLFRAQMMEEEKKILRRNEIELIKKFTLSVACIIFFFIGAPLGAIIRKGGLGTPLVISVLLFVVYYIIDNTGYKMARDGKIIVWAGMWLSTFILAPLGVYVTWKAMNDSAVFDMDRYKAFLRRLIGARAHRSVASKEVIINDISTSEAIRRLQELSAEASSLGRRYARRLSYSRYWLEGMDTDAIAHLGATTDSIVDYMSDCRNPQIVGLLSDFPVIGKLWIQRPSRMKWIGRTMMILFPLGLPLYLAGLRAQRDLRDDCASVRERCALLEERLNEESKH